MAAVATTGTMAPQNVRRPKATLSLHKGQMSVYQDNTRFKVVVAGRRWGKTQLAKTEIIREAKRPRRKIWYVAPTYRMAKQIMWDELKAAIPRAWIKRVHETLMLIELINGTQIECKGADKPDTLRGVGLSLVVLDEYQDMKPDTWHKVLRPTLARDRGNAIFIGTPKGFANIYEVYRYGLEGGPKSWRSWQFPTRTSPFIPLEEIEAARAEMDPRDFRQEFEASFENMSGRVYYAFDRQIHVSDKVAFNPQLPIWIGQDFNVDPMATVILQPQPNGQVWAVDEIYLSNSNTLEVCEEIERRYWQYDKQIVVYPDPACVNRGSARGESDLDIFREKGFHRIKYRRKHPERKARFAAVNRMLRDARGQVRFYVSPNCKNLIDSFEQTLYRPGSVEIDKTAGMEHITDGLGYCLELEFPTRKVKVGGLSL